MTITTVIDKSEGMFSVIKALSIITVIGVLTVFTLSFEARAADDGVSFQQELIDLGKAQNPPFSEKFVSAFLADPRFAQYATTPPEDGTSKEIFAKMAFGNYLNEQVSGAQINKHTVTAADFQNELEAHIDNNFSTAPEMALKAGLIAYMKEKYPNGFPDPMTLTQAERILGDFSSWMKSTPYRKLGGKFNDKDGKTLEDSLKLNILGDLRNQIALNIRNGDYLPATTTPPAATPTPPVVAPPAATPIPQIKPVPQIKKVVPPPVDTYIIDEDPTGFRDRNSPRDQGLESAPSTAPSPAAPPPPPPSEPDDGDD